LPKSINKWVVGIIALVFFSPIASGILKKGKEFAPFSLIDVSGKTVTARLEDGQLTIITEYGKDGKKEQKKSYPDAILLDFWATWCEPCRAAMPFMQELYDKYRADENQETGGLELFGIALDERGSMVVKPIYDKLDTTYPMLADPTEGSGNDGLIRTAKDMKSVYKVQVLPVVYLIGSEGTIEHVHVGFKKKHMERLDQVIGSLISGESR